MGLQPADRMFGSLCEPPRACSVESMMALDKRLLGIAPLVMFVLAACSSSESTSSVEDAGVADAADGSTTEPDAASDADASVEPDANDVAPNACEAASQGLSSTADAMAPVLDASTSNLQRVSSNDTYCANQKSGAFPTFGAYGYLLNVFLRDDDGDAPSLDELTTAGTVRFGASPSFDVTGKFDIAHGFSTQGQGFILQLCLDQVYTPGSVTIAVDVADKGKHRSKAICITEASGG